MREPVRFKLVTTQQQFDELKDFSASDGHLVTDTKNSLLPIYTMHRGSKKFGFFHVLAHPVIMPSFHIDLCEPRDFKEACDKIGAWQQFESMGQRFPSGTTFIAIPPNPAISVELIEGMGFEDMQRNIWQQTPKEDE